TQPRKGLAAIDSHGQLSAWNPNPDSYVDSLTVAGSTVYVGGEFSQIGGQQRTELAALDPTTGQATAWNANVSCSPYCDQIRAMTVSGSTLDVGGTFQASFGGQARNHAVALDTST